MATDWTRAQQAKFEEQKVVGTIEKREGEEVRVQCSVFKGTPRIDIRTWTESENGEWRATKAGVNIKSDQAEDLVKLIERAREGLSNN